MAPKTYSKVVDGHSIICDAETSTRLGGIRQKDTTPERAVRGVLYGLGLRYRVRNRDLPGSPDIANRSAKWAIFVHGCYWHRHPGCERMTTPKRNRDFWLAKFNRNKERDREALEALAEMGYTTSVVWECETEDDRVLTDILSEFAGAVGPG